MSTVPYAVHVFLRKHIEEAAKKYKVTVVCNSTDAHLLHDLNVPVILLPIERKPSFWCDALVVIRLYMLFRREHFAIVHSIMPKTGMIAMLAAWLARVPIRIHTFTGQVWVTKRGLKRAVLKWVDKLIGKFATCLLADSPSQRDFLVSEGALPFGKVKVIADGSICGVEAARFHPDSNIMMSVRKDLKISEDAVVILFVGRLSFDKGILDLAVAFDSIARMCADVVLIIAGAEEDVLIGGIRQLCSRWAERLHYIKFTSSPENYMAAADIFCLPSYREGFGMTIIEAAACAVPTVGSCIYGITDAVVDGETGLLFPAGNVAALTLALLVLIKDIDLRQRMGKAARLRALKLFSSERITGEMVTLYDRLSEVR
ncbi:MAG: glycosyltransferase [Rhodoferax sp.]|nr:glycosyltransferase [Rhodoferax sp.]MDP3651355.1 glycosyltransferase [Rhodoferax sp.]